MPAKYGINDVGALHEACRDARRIELRAKEAKEFFKEKFQGAESRNEFLSYLGDSDFAPLSFLMGTPFGTVRADFHLVASSPRKYQGKFVFSLLGRTAQGEPTASPRFSFVFDEVGYASFNDAYDQEWRFELDDFHSDGAARTIGLQLQGALVDGV